MKKVEFVETRRTLHKYSVLLSIFVLFDFNSAEAEVLDLDSALRNTYVACVGIDDNLHDLKVLAGINTAVTSVGTGVGIGAVATGFVKASKDKQIAELEDLLQELEELSDKYDGPDTTQENVDSFMAEFEKSYNEALSETKTNKKQIDDLTKQSKKLGNWRTGLMATNTATNIAGVILANKSKVNKNLAGQIDTCVVAVKQLNNAMSAAKINGEDVSEAQSIYSACREYEFVDISPINKRGTGAMVASSIGAVAGGVGTITSGVANSDNTRNDNSETGKQKEKNLNDASNILAVGATAASATATVFNATQIAAIKKVASVAEKCTEVLK